MQILGRLLLYAIFAIPVFLAVYLFFFTNGNAPLNTPEGGDVVMVFLGTIASSLVLTVAGAIVTVVLLLREKDCGDFFVATLIAASPIAFFILWALHLKSTN